MRDITVKAVIVQGEEMKIRVVAGDSAYATSAISGELTLQEAETLMRRLQASLEYCNKYKGL